MLKPLILFLMFFSFGSEFRDGVFIQEAPQMKLTREQIIQNFENSLPAHLGNSNFISQKDLDQGDSAQRFGTLSTLISIIKDDAITRAFMRSGHPSRVKSFDLLKADWGIYRRSPDSSFWGYNPNNLSRDQLSILKIGMISIDDQKRLRSVAVRQALRFGFHQNTRKGTDDLTNSWKMPDPMSPGELAVYCRGFLGNMSLIPNHILDFSLLINLALRDPNNWDQDNMMALELLFSDSKHPTIWSRIAMQSYLKTNFMKRLWNYHRNQDGNNGCEPLYWLFRLAFLDKYGYEPGDAP
jgi:hypothetical protein